MLIISKGKASTLGRYNASRLTATQRFESLQERNKESSGDSTIDKERDKEAERIYKEINE